jgi:hypothetical protein
MSKSVPKIGHYSDQKHIVIGQPKFGQQHQRLRQRPIQANEILAFVTLK